MNGEEACVWCSSEYWFCRRKGSRRAPKKRVRISVDTLQRHWEPIAEAIGVCGEESFARGWSTYGDQDLFADSFCSFGVRDNFMYSLANYGEF